MTDFDFQLTTPVTFLIFNRPDKTAEVFEQIRRARPPQLLVVADGPRANHPDDSDKCRAARAVIEQVDWPCDVLTNYSNVNLGCGRRVSGGLNWVFSVVEETIVLEDDCLPHPSFFRFCQELLERYRIDERVMHISGDNFHPAGQSFAHSYYFSCFNYIWGWASWRRAWQRYDFTMAKWQCLKREGWLNGVFDSPRDVRYWTNIFDLVSNGQMDTWDFQWTFTCWSHSGLCVVPSFNLISNIGFDVEATQTKKATQLANLPVQEMRFPLQHPPFVMRNRRMDRQIQDSLFREPGLRQRAVNKIGRMFEQLNQTASPSTPSSTTPA